VAQDKSMLFHRI